MKINLKRKERVIRYITDDLEISSDGSDKENFDKENQKIIFLPMMSHLRGQIIYNYFSISVDVFIQGAIYK